MTNHDDVSVVGGSVPTVTSSLTSLINKYEGTSIITARNNRFEVALHFFFWAVTLNWKWMMSPSLTT